MTRIVAPLFATASLFALAACGAPKNEAAPAETATEPMTTEAPAEPMPMEPAPADPAEAAPPAIDPTMATPPADSADDGPGNSSNDKGRPGG